MILLPVNSVKQFKQKASKISNNRIIPICNYIRIQFHAGECVLTKTNNNAFVTQTFDAEGKGDQEYMILEKDLFPFADHSLDDFLTIKMKDDKLFISDSSSSAPCQTTKDAFPALERPGEQTIVFSPATVKAIKAASKMLGNEEMATWRSYVFVGHHKIIGCDGFVALSIPTEIEDRIILGKEVIASLPDNGAIYRQNKAYDFFETGRSLYGFIKPEQKFFDMTGSVKETSETSFVFTRAALLSFNDWVLDMALKPEFCEADFDFKNGLLQLSGRETYSEKSVERNIKSTGGWPFKYLPSQMNKILKFTDDETLLCYKGEKNICITNETNSFYSLLQGII